MSPSARRTVAVATDSSASAPAELRAQWGLAVVPLQVVVGAKAHAEGLDIDTAKVVAAMGEGATVSTSRPTPGALATAVMDARSSGASALVFVTLAGATSGTADAMRAYAKTVDFPIEVVDSATLALATGLAAVSAACVAAAGGSVEDVVAEAKRASRLSVCVFTVDTLEYLRRGGRVNAAVAAMGKALGIRPLLGVVDGEVQVVNRLRSSPRARLELVDRLAVKAATYRHPVIGLMGLAGEPHVQAARDELGRRGRWPVVEAELSAALAAHGGPGTLAGVVVDVHPQVVEALAS